MTTATVTASDPSRIRKLAANAVAASLMIIFLTMMFSCGGSDDNTNDGSSVKPAQDAAGREYDRRRDM